ncbi:hypothetical protein L1S34_01230 [Flavobacterium sp. K77]|uniref:hypothetical protein n=1 Tax=Flavobacterium sp. K77 TaxID=2910676 RepID=UPI001F31D5B6|nr:hypothetical protein [Flavobacterium sp. K77]MCF6139901.1 hypothetical protein [Flavobacterium sp. K77]
MENLKLFLERRKKAFIFSIIYVGIGTLSVCSISGSDLFYGEWSLYALILTFPVTIISFAYRYAASDYLIPVLIIQSIMFLITFSIFAAIFKEKPH